MDDPEVRLGGYRRVGRSEVRRGERVLHAARNLVDRTIAPFFDVRCFDRRLIVSVEELLERGHGFAVAQAHAQRRFGQALELVIRPADIVGFLTDWATDGGRCFHLDCYFVGSGDWKPLVRSLSENAVVREAFQLVDENMQYKKTVAYEAYVAAFKDGRPIRRNGVPLASESLVDAYFESFVALFDSISSHGIVRRRLLGRRHRRRDSAVRRVWSEIGERDIGVARDIDGTLRKLSGGQHRIGVALALGIDQIPVELRLCHARWLSVQLHNAGEGLARAFDPINTNENGRH